MAIVNEEFNPARDVECVIRWQDQNVEDAEAGPIINGRFRNDTEQQVRVIVGYDLGLGEQNQTIIMSPRFPQQLINLDFSDRSQLRGIAVLIPG